VQEQVEITQAYDAAELKKQGHQDEQRNHQPDFATYAQIANQSATHVLDLYSCDVLNWNFQCRSRISVT
jgi:hypothetical protein